MIEVSKELFLDNIDFKQLGVPFVYSFFSKKDTY